MVWNDYFDLAVDRRERPFRPLPSGKISLAAARALGLGLLVAGMAFAAVAGRSPEGWRSDTAMLTAFGFFIGIPLVKAIAQPEPKNVQAAIKQCIMGLVLFDAVLATAYAGLWGLLVALLLIPALLLGRRVYST